MTPKLRLAELVQVFAARIGIVRIVHRNIRRGLASAAGVLKVLAISAFQDIYLGIMDPGVHMVIQSAIFSA